MRTNCRIRSKAADRRQRKYPPTIIKLKVTWVYDAAWIIFIF